MKASVYSLFIRHDRVKKLCQLQLFESANTINIGFWVKKVTGYYNFIYLNDRGQCANPAKQGTLLNPVPDKLPPAGSDIYLL